METWDERLTLRRASSLGQMPHGRWRILVDEGRSTGIAESETVPWTARVVDYGDGPQLGFTTFRLSDMVHKGTGEELALGLTKMLVGAHTTRRQSETGMISHSVMSNRGTDTRSMLAAVGLDVTNTNPRATAPAQTSITAGDDMATTRCHRDVWDAALVQLGGSKELLVHPPISSLPGCPAHIFDEATDTRKSWWLYGFEPFGLDPAHTSLWVKIVLIPGNAVVLPRGWWHAVRSTPGSVAISVAIRAEHIDERTTARRSCRRNLPAPDCPKIRRTGSERGVPPHPRRDGRVPSATGLITFYYALGDKRLADLCSLPYPRL